MPPARLQVWVLFFVFLICFVLFVDSWLSNVGNGEGAAAIH